MFDVNSKRNELELLGLKPDHKKILLCISPMAKPVAMIARHTGIPRSSLVYMLETLHKMSFVKVITHGKKKHWKSDMRRVLHGVACLQNGTVLREGKV